jgi:hypothetical protein
MHYDGVHWKNLAPGGTETFWWVHGTSGHDVWAVGEKGRIVHWDGSAFTSPASGTTATLFGVWAAAPNDVWAVGGTPSAGTTAPNDVVLHYDGTAWSPSPVPMALGHTFFKVWGAAPDDLYVVGGVGTVWHRTGGAWTLESQTALTVGSLFAVTGSSAREVYAVGGRDILLRGDAGTWAKLPLTLANDVGGVGCAAPGGVVIVGSGGLKERLVAGRWIDDTLAQPRSELHGAWADPSGGFWAAGGDYVTSPRDGGTRYGVLAYYGTQVPTSDLVP